MKKVPFVLTGSIRDDGPLPDVITDSMAGQDAMREHAKKATMAILVFSGASIAAYFGKERRGVHFHEI